mgnify:CR=1 FL=1
MTHKKYPYIARGNQRYFLVQTHAAQNIDNGGGSTADTVVVGGLPTDAEIVGAWPQYTEATDTAGVATATWSLGVAAGGATIVAATALEVSKAVGAVGASQPGLVPLLAGQTLFMRHTGVATTETGEYILNVLLMLKP